MGGGGIDNPEIKIAGIAISCALIFSFVSEIISWFLVFRHDDYKKAVAEIVRLQDEVSTMNEKIQYSEGSLSVSQQKAHQRKL